MYFSFFNENKKSCLANLANGLLFERMARLAFFLLFLIFLLSASHTVGYLPDAPLLNFPVCINPFFGRPNHRMVLFGCQQAPFVLHASLKRNDT